MSVSVHQFAYNFEKGTQRRGAITFPPRDFRGNVGVHSRVGVVNGPGYAVAGSGSQGVSGQGTGDGVQDGQAVVAGRGEVGLDQAPSVQGLVGLPVPGYGLMSIGGFDAAFGGVGGPVDSEVAGEVPDLLGVGLHPGGQDVRGVVAVAVPVAVAVVDDPGVDRLVVALTQCGQPVRVQGGLAASLGGFDLGVGPGQGGGGLAGPGRLEGAGAELGHGPAAARDVLNALLDPGQHGTGLGQQPLVGAVPVHDQVPGERAQRGDHRVVAAGNQANQP